MEIVNGLLLSLDNGNISIVTVLELSAAFDTTGHRLEHVSGIHGTAL